MRIVARIEDLLGKDLQGFAYIPEGLNSPVGQRTHSAAVTEVKYIRLYGSLEGQGILWVWELCDVWKICLATTFATVHIRTHSRI
jgi:hypothetical protein